MSKTNNLDWENSVTLKEYFDAKINNIEQATSVARIAMENRLTGMNEFRETLKDQASKLMTRAEVDILMDKINNDIRILRESRATLEGKASATSVYVAYAISLVGMFIGILSLIK